MRDMGNCAAVTKVADIAVSHLDQSQTIIISILIAIIEPQVEDSAAVG